MSVQRVVGIPHPFCERARKRQASRRLLILLLSVLTSLSRELAAREFPPPPLAAKPLVLPAPVVRVLPNRLTVIVVERHALPLLTLRLLVKAGAESDPPTLPGTAQLVAALLTQGTTTRSAREIAEAVDSVGGTIETGAEWDHSFIALSVLKDHAQLAFDLLTNVATQPTFLPAEVERQRQQTLSSLKIARDDPSYLADTTFRRLSFAGTAYAHPQDGTAETVQRITAQELQDFHARHYQPSNCVLAVVGDISAKEASERTLKTWGSWKNHPAPLSTTPSPVSPLASGQTIVIDKPEAVQTEIRVGHVALHRNSPDYYALSVANQVLGGPGGNRLFKALRSDRGLTYAASSDILCHRTAGSWMAKTATRTLETPRSIQTTLEQIKQLRERPITEQERETAEGYLIGHLVLDFESSEDIATHLLEVFLYDLPLDYWNRFPDRIRATTAHDALSAARRYLDPKHNTVVLVGDATAFGDELEKLGPFRTIPIAKLDFTSPTLERSDDAAGKR